MTSLFWNSQWNEPMYVWEGGLRNTGKCLGRAARCNSLYWMQMIGSAASNLKGPYSQQQASQCHFWGFHFPSGMSRCAPQASLFFHSTPRSPISRVLPAATPVAPQPVLLETSYNTPASRLSAVGTTVSESQRGTKYTQQECDVSEEDWCIDMAIMEMTS